MPDPESPAVTRDEVSEEVLATLKALAGAATREAEALVASNAEHYAQAFKAIAEGAALLKL